MKILSVDLTIVLDNLLIICCHQHSSDSLLQKQWFWNPNCYCWPFFNLFSFRDGEWCLENCGSGKLVIRSQSVGIICDESKESKSFCVFLSISVFKISFSLSLRFSNKGLCVSASLRFYCYPFFLVQRALLGWFGGLPSTKALTPYSAKVLRCKL